MTTRASSALAIGLAGAMLAGCTSPFAEPQLSADAFEAKVGALCQDCEVCSTHLETCRCSTCTDYARDAVAKQWLVCAGGVWTKYRDCPGGVSIACAAKGSYSIECFDAAGNPVR